MLDTLTFGFLGGGNMASALIGGLIARGVPAGAIRVVDPFPEAQQRLARDLGVHAAGAPDAAFGASDVLVLAVKPQQFRDATEQLLPHLPGDGPGNLVISVAAGIRLQDMQRWLGGRNRVVRAMPNTPALSGMGMTGLAAPAGLSAKDRAIASAVAEAVGKCVWVDGDDQIDAVTAISGSGPAYVFYFIEAMQRAATELGLSAEQGRDLAVETFRGAATLAGQSPEPVATLRERVTSKGGTTHAALTSMEASGIADAFVRAMHAAAARGKEMGAEFGKD
ncbi:pyrroline-5-carboxylate reductase [Cupriavidus alkaliphilus]|uniref:Pyrroline-5-carboxylate reductase n=1 Tax=Cupriavidus alkaliphilus TaxID=942866 RepID=A0A7W4V5S7_9BURK|nr:pyrroline-5-carboxylate reductase [Cupriavidus alkaliphilus]MBB3005568.1 pyrroline-5-carboxylate reductase [Cupriavidus alkaliphilus]PVY81716.1 pyrroline-5-carboxylate reductase [Cupriavidus alkaliphilus]SCB07708.1 pyrroline-5-carboxylate reductase [Cupriavidus alkaliphilus]